MTAMDKVLSTVHQAIEIEKFGYEFYSNMRPFVNDRKGQRFVSYLARLEADHIFMLEEEYARQLEKLEEFDEGVEKILSLVGKEKIFLRHEKLPEIFRDFDAVKAIRFAIDVEKNSVEFYEDSGAASDDDRLKELFIRLADFERDHITILERNLESLEARKGWEPPPRVEKH